MRLAQRRQDVGIRMERLLRARAERISRLRTQLEERSPLRVLERGYAVAYDSQGNVVRSAEQVQVGDSVSIQLARGRLSTEVRKKKAG